jgi:hypothetical protein
MLCAHNNCVRLRSFCIFLKLGVDNCAVDAILYITVKQTNALEEHYMQTVLNRITYYFLQRAYTQLETEGELQNADDVAEFLEDYFAAKVI